MKIRRFKLGVLGSSGRMGTEVDALLAESRFQGRLEKVAAPRSADGMGSLFAAEVWLDFSTPTAGLALCREAVARKSKTPLVIGTTGWKPSELVELEQAAQAFPILRAPNFSLGVLLARAALRSWGGVPELTNWTFSIRDLHHAGKKDAPSGTALSLQEAFGRDAEITSLREGDAVGLHEVVLESRMEKLVLTHEAKSRAVFAEGALETVLRLANSDPKTLPKRLLSLEDLYLKRDA